MAELIEYVRRGGKRKTRTVKKGDEVITLKGKGGHKRGVFVAVPLNGTVRIGWTLCNTSAGDEFSPEFGIEVAINRAKTGTKRPVPQSLQREIDQFIKRAERYYKDKKVVLANQDV